MTLPMKFAFMYAGLIGSGDYQPQGSRAHSQARFPERTQELNEKASVAAIPGSQAKAVIRVASGPVEMFLARSRITGLAYLCPTLP